MKAEIINIEKTDKFIRVEFKFENGEWAQTYLVPAYRNFKRWESLLKVGNWLDNVKLKESEMVDADSFPVLRKYPDMSLEDEKLMEFSRAIL